MKIKDVEKKTGITKANIRYYESQGLITPERELNGYRTYTEKNVHELLRIKLLRTLDIPIESIRALCDGKTSLADTLSIRKAQFQDQHHKLDLSEEVIGILLAAGVEYEKLDPDAYLDLLEDQLGDTLKRDVNPKPSLPWRRLWARTFDFTIYNLMLYVLFPSMFHSEGFNIFLILAQIILLVALEPLMLCLFYTTPGKAIWGMTITSLEGKRLSYKEALNRTLLVLQHGLGFCAPFLMEYMQYSSLTAAEAGKELIWEQDSELNIRDAKIWRYFLFAVLFVAAMAYPVRSEYQRFISNIEPTYQGDTPFFNIYRIEEAENYTDEHLEQPPLIEIGNGDLRFFHKNYTQSAFNTIGVFEYAPPNDDPYIGLWQMHSDADPDQLYELRIDEEGNVNLHYYEYGLPIWSWKLSRVNTLDVGFLNRLQSNYIRCEWYGDGMYTGDMDLLQIERISADTNLTFIFVENAPSVLNIVEERIQYGSITTSKINLYPQENGTFAFPIKPEDIPEDTTIIYHIPYANGEYIFAVQS